MAASTVKKPAAKPAQKRPAAKKPIAKKPLAKHPTGQKPEQGQNTAAVPKPAAKPVAAKKRRVKKEKDPNRIGFFYGKGSIDVPMLVITVVLLVIGITMMFSASHVLSYRDNDGDSYGYAVSQMTFALVGLIAMFVLSFVDYRLLRKEFKIKPFGKELTFTFAHLALIFGLFLTFLVIPFGVSNTEGGPRRWLPFIGRTFQPSDVLKFTLIIFFAYYIAKNYKKMRYTMTGLVKPAILLVVVTWLMLEQPHLSGLLIMLVIAAALLFIGGVNMKTVIIIGGVAVVLLVVAVMASEFTYFEDRIKYTFDPLADTDNKTYQSYQAVLAIGSGGMWGVGFGNSSQKYYYLPDAENDFVFAILCEEFGFVGGALVVLLFMIFVFRGFYIARKSEDRFGMLLATGITLQVGIQALLNIGVNCCCIPNTGISMPFFSYGGTALVIQLAEVGLLMSVSRRAKLN